MAGKRAGRVLLGTTKYCPESVGHMDPPGQRVVVCLNLQEDVANVSSTTYTKHTSIHYISLEQRCTLVIETRADGASFACFGSVFPVNTWGFGPRGALTDDGQGKSKHSLKGDIWSFVPSVTEAHIRCI